MNQPPQSRPPAQWRRPRGVAAGTWAYTQQRRIADHYDAFVAETPLCRLDRQLVADVFPGCDCRQPEIILDLGCGSGRTAIPLAQRGYRVIGIDLSQPMLEVLQSKLDARRTGVGQAECDREFGGPGMLRIHTLRANLVELDGIADRSAGHAVCLFSTLGMIHGKLNRRRMLAQVARILRPGGQLVLHVHNRWAALSEPNGISRLSRSWLRSCRDREHDFGDATYAYRGLDAMFMHRFSRREIASELNSTGWSVGQVVAVSLDGASEQRSAGWLQRWAGGFLVRASLR